MHESQSRLWENQVGRSAAFWQLPAADRARASSRRCAGSRSSAVLLAVNEARPSLIRTEADEITYNLHIILRFELERALIDGSLRGARPAGGVAREDAALPRRRRRATDRDGVLQDVHWASGAIGYFPTYTLGNVYAAQLLRAAEADARRARRTARGRRVRRAAAAGCATHVHRLGQTYRAPQLIAAAPPAHAPSPAPLLEHLQRKVAFLEALQTRPLPAGS